MSDRALSVAARIAARVEAPSAAEVHATLRNDALRQIVAALPQYAFVLDRGLRIVFANRGLGTLAASQLEGSPIAALFPPRINAVAEAAMHRILATGLVDGFTAQIDGADAEEARCFDVRLTPIRFDSHVIGMTLIATETTEQVRAERAIATQARMIESMLEGVALINSEGVIEITNPAFDAMFGYRRGALISQQMAALAGFPLQQPERWCAPCGAQPGSAIIEFEAKRSDGGVFAAAGVLSRFEIGGRLHSLVVLQDVSERKQLERAILEAVNREQYRIGNDLHDGVGQELTGIALMLRGVAGRLTTEYPGILPEIEGITQLVNNAIESTRALARGLSPVNLERGGLKDALEGLAIHASELYGVQVQCTYKAPPQPLNPELANHLYRIAQEAIRNAVRHGRARLIRVQLQGTRAKVRLMITDDGLGLPKNAADAPGMGLRIMSYRARMLGGEVRFERAEPKGVRVVCECPTESAAPRAARISRSSR